MPRISIQVARSPPNLVIVPANFFSCMTILYRHPCISAGAESPAPNLSSIPAKFKRSICTCTPVTYTYAAGMRVCVMAYLLKGPLTTENKHLPAYNNNARKFQDISADFGNLQLDTQAFKRVFFAGYAVIAFFFLQATQS
jgi:hypothetical protein